MRPSFLLVVALAIPTTVQAQSTDGRDSASGVMWAYERLADIFGSRLVEAFDSIPAAKYDYRPTPSQQSIGYIAQHLEDANYDLCERMSDLRHPQSAKDLLADSVKARWPKDTLVARLRASVAFCDLALERVQRVESAMLASTLLAFETDLAEHYSQLSVYMRLLGMVPPSAIPPRARTAVTLPSSELARNVGVYLCQRGVQFDVTMRDGSLVVRANTGGPALKLRPESASDFFVKEIDAQIIFTRDASGGVSGLVLHQFGRERRGKKIQ
jgi:uncharacterized damage-inducible protein DinB